MVVKDILLFLWMILTSINIGLNIKRINILFECMDLTNDSLRDLYEAIVEKREEQ